jgi:glycosyltransferase involved in cell wall biosynthesis
VTVVVDNYGSFMDADQYDEIVLMYNKSKLNQLIAYIKIFLTYAFKNDVFIFLYGKSLLPYNLDLPILKLLRKKTIMWFVGCDIRHYTSQLEFSKKTGEDTICSFCNLKEDCVLEKKQYLVRMAEKYATHIISGKMISNLLTREYFIISAPLDVENIRFNNIRNNPPVIVHAPTSRKMKGTDYIIETINRLRSEGYKFEFKMFENMSNHDVRRELSDSDICIDQLFSVGNGMFANEAMAAGCAVLCGNLPQYSGRPVDLPVIHTRPDNLYKNLKILLDNPELVSELGEKGRKYVLKYHDSLKVADAIIDMINSDNK